MKKRNTFLALALVIAILVLGVGYAAITAVNFVVKGNISTYGDPTLFNVAFTNAKQTSDTSDGVVTDVNLDDTDENGRTATFEVSKLSKTGDMAEFELTILNSSEELAAVIDSFDVVGLDDYKNANEDNLIAIDVSYTNEEHTNKNANWGAESFEIAPGKEAKLYVQFILTELAIDDLKIEDVQLTFNANPKTLPIE